MHKHNQVLDETFCLKGFTKSYHTLFKIFIFAVVILLNVTMASSEDVYGYKAVQGTVTVKSGKVRKDADANSAFVFGVTKDEIVTVIGEKKSSDGNLWYQIKVMNATGYIRSDLVKKSNIEVKGESTIEIEDSNKDTQKKEENTNKEETESVDANASKDITVSTDEFNAIVKCSNVIVREEASTSSGIRTMVQKGLLLKIISQSTGADGKIWYYVSFVANNGTQKGFIRSDLVLASVQVPDDKSKEPEKEEPAKEPVTNPGEPQKTQIGKIKGMGVNIRELPVTGKVIGKLNTGAQITVIEQVRAKEDMNIWCKINFIYNNKPLTGYVRSDFTDGIALHVPGEGGEKPEQPETPENPENPENPEDGDKEENKEGIKPGIPSQYKSTASIKGIGVRIRDAAVTGNIVCQLDTGYPVYILNEVDGSDGYKWYQIAFSKNDVAKAGFVRSDLVVVTKEEFKEGESDEEFEKQIKDFPNDYKGQLRALHEKYPNWKFVAVNTGLDWSNVVVAETVVGKNLVAKSSIASWKSTAPQAYNWQTNTWYGFDGGSWAAASPELIKYYLDPRNFLDDSGIFQFETLEFEDYHNEEGITNIVSSTFMKNSVRDTDGVERTYQQMFMDAGKTFGISPYHLASRCVQEQGAAGTSQSISGTVAGLENLFNYFNIGAYAAGGRTATINGLIYAAGADQDYFRPWNTRFKSIAGAARYISEKYIKVGQNTLYFQKFNVVNSKNGIYSHQYMSNIVAASYESARLKKAYSDLNTTLVFRIPVYSNMPVERCAKPISDSNPNTYLSDIKIEGYEFTSPFSSVTNLYYLNVAENVEYLNISATAVSPLSTVGGTGVVKINKGDNKIQIICKAQNGSSKIYTIIVRRG